MQDAKRLLLCTDLDRTLIPNGSAPESPQSRERFAALANQPGVTLVYATGRHLALLEEAIEAFSIPRPDLAITDVGTRIYQRTEASWQPLTGWEEHIRNDWGDWNSQSLHLLFAGIQDLSLQEVERIHPLKLSYYLPLDRDHHSVLSLMQGQLERHAVRASLTWSIDEGAGLGLLDVLPSSAGKLGAIEYVRKKLHFDHPETVFAGDSGNDLPVLSSPIPAVLVANARPQVREMAQLESRRTGTLGRLYLAKGGFQKLNGNYSAGILEGIAHFRPDLIDWFS